MPVYNTEEFLCNCIDSILNQTYKKIELILVNDGSEDQSLKICQEYEIKDSRVIVVNKSNEGVSIARNIGIIKSNGKYLQFVDSDDFIEKNMTELLVDSIKKYDSDMAICGINSFDRRRLLKKNKIKEIIRTENSKPFFAIDEFLEILLKYKTDVFFGSPDNKLYKKELITRNNLKFEPNINFAEDFLFNLEYFRHLNCVSVVNRCLYYYRRDVQNSITKTERKTEDFWLQFKAIFESYKKTFQELEIYERNIDKINSFMIMALDATLWNCSKEFPGLINEKKINLTKDICEDLITTGIQKKIYCYSKNEQYIVNLLNIKQYFLLSIIYSIKINVYTMGKRCLSICQDRFRF